MLATGRTLARISGAPGHPEADVRRTGRQKAEAGKEEGDNGHEEERFDLIFGEDAARVDAALMPARSST